MFCILGSYYTVKYRIKTKIKEYYKYVNRPCSPSFWAARVGKEGPISMNGGFVNFPVGVRPAFWLNLDS